MKLIISSKSVLLRTILGLSILSSIYATKANATNAAYSEKTCTCSIGYDEQMNLWGYYVMGTYDVTYTNTLDKGWSEGLTENLTVQLTGNSYSPTYDTAINLCGLSINSLKASRQCSANSVAPTSNAVNTSEVGERTKYFTLSAQEQQQWNYLNQSEQRRFEFAIAMAEINSNNHAIDSDSRLYRAIADIYANQAHEDRNLLKELLRKVKMGHKRRH